MTADIINLRRVRKDKARAEDKRGAEDNRVAFGRTKAEKSLTKAKTELAERKLDGHRRED